MNLVSPKDIDHALRAQLFNWDTLREHPNAPVLNARLALYLQKPPEMLGALSDLRDRTDLQAIGLTIALCAQLGLHDDALSIAFDDALVRTELDEDGAYWAHRGRCGSLAATERFAQALEEIGMARVSAHRLGIPALVTAALAERQRIAGLAALGDAEDTLELLERMPRQTGLYRWHEQTYLSDRLAEGDYKLVGGSAFRDRPAHKLARALLGLPEEGLPLHHPIQQAAQMFYALRSDQPVGMPLGGRGMVDQYSRIAAGFSLASKERTAAQALIVLGSRPPRRHDQKFLWACGQLLAFMNGATVDHPLELVGMIGGELDLLRETRDVLSLVAHVAPEVLILLSVGPRAHETVALAAMATPILHGGRVINMDAETDYARPARSTVVIQGIERMTQAAADMQRLVLARQWAQARYALDFLLQGSVDSSQSVHCVQPVRGATVEA